MKRESQKSIWFGQKKSIRFIPEELSGLIHELVNIFLNEYTNQVRSVYIHGSATTGKWQKGTSDIDITCILNSTKLVESLTLNCQKKIEHLDKRQNIVSFIDASCINFVDFQDSSLHTQSKMFSLAATGISIYGESDDYRLLLPETLKVVKSRTKRFCNDIEKKLNGKDHEIFSGSKFISRSLQKNAIRILTGGVLLKGGPFYPDADKALEKIETFYPEALDIASEAYQLLLSKSINVTQSRLIFRDSLLKLGNDFPEVISDDVEKVRRTHLQA